MSNDAAPTTRTRTTSWGFVVFAALALVHVGAITLGAEPLVYPTKLLLMPALAGAVLLAHGGRPWRAVDTWLIAAIALSWLGDGAALFFPFVSLPVSPPELPLMLLCFGLAHLAYILLFARLPGARRVPAWAVVYGAWWVAMLLVLHVLHVHLGALLIPVAVYGLVLAGTAAMSTRGGTVTAIGGALFLASDTLLALRLFLPGVSETMAGPWIMATYAAGQGLLAWGVVRRAR
ncbi:lysoplasmalogenase [Microbacterium sp. W1N]|uniref:lysoplasmalogenase n=1 Tax=Microbacterium festucae TaxID=2977531 RepID=UPI0021C0E193|nr:lysoplasmalogenase [Microbacterium festucae]MCT9821191.1 lysoplasmalogenase [Microbacterium festucae]